MYGSMWRLVVSVAPPETAKWESIAQSAGSVIYEILTRGDDAGGPIENDKYMTMEIEASLQGDKIASKNGSVWIQMPDGSETEMPIWKFQFLEEVSATLESLDDFKEVLKSRDGKSAESEALKTSLLKFKKLIDQGRVSSRSPRQRTSTKVEPQPDGGETLAPTLFDTKQETVNIPTNEELARMIEIEFDAMLENFKQAFAENEWEKVQNFRGVFIERANLLPQRRQVIFDKLRSYRNSVQFMPQERP
jgi:hypothetical protein